MIFQCTNCGGNVIYSPEKKGMYCPFCESEKSQKRKDGEGEMTICPNCGGEISMEEHTSATQCPFCDTYVILDERIGGEYTPELIIPFGLSKDMVKKLLREKFKKHTFAPTDFLSEVKLNTMEGNYVPFWMYDYDVNYHYQGEGRKMRYWKAGDIEYTETSVYDIQRNMDVKFENVPVDASVKMPDEVMDLMEPYRYEELTAFSPEYLSGFMGEKYNMPAEGVEDRARRKIEDDTVELVKQSISGYGSVVDKSKNLRVDKQKAKCGLLPVWKYSYRYKDQDFPFYINGQTSKIVGTVPISRKKVWVYGATLCGALMAILIFGYYGFMML